ncbi:actin-like ATPase domain-containing protein [Cylindrobasidium torrendii FP15055 ss-10]|uniref:Actin-like ATPase domain-containing protein n=1 Tax=Cylindrobasidium torrendii FP15055 ss-10 TaxID=1314674 RepID=A0A0D7BSL4_9AGAR|nr:actin-like ATPase domain-containing protein [Cylindrobasidium torrendii FP15055 ss-10]
MAAPNGTAEPTTESHNLPPVVGINFGNSYASIAEGLAESIANEDGERQIACALSFHGEQMYIGSPAKQQLVKNSENTIIGFRNLIGKKFSEITSEDITPNSAPVIQHPDEPDVAAYKVEVLTTPAALPTKKTQTPAASAAATPAPEPVPTDRILSVSEVTTIFIGSLLQSASDFLGKKIQGAVITVPPHFTPAQVEALEKAATDAGVKVYQTLEEAAATLITTSSALWAATLRADRTQLYVDLGSSSLSLSVVENREGLGHVVASSSTTSIGANQIDDKLVTFFAADFTKKNKVPLKVCPATEVQDKRAEAKLRLAIEHTKRTLSASPGAATCSVESLKDGYDFTGSVNRMRFDMLAKPVYSAVSAAVSDLLKSAGVDAHQIDEIVYVGGTSCLPGLDEEIGLSVGFPEDVATPFSMGTVVGGGIGDPTTILARGSAVQAALLHTLEEDDLRAAFSTSVEAPALGATVALYVPGAEAGIVALLKDTPLPARRVQVFEVEVTESSKAFGFELWEIEQTVRVEKVKPPKVVYSDDEGGADEDDEEEEEIEEKHKETKKVTLLGAATADAKLAIQTKGKGPDAGKWFTTVEATVVVTEAGALSFDVKEIGEGGAVLSIEIS